MDTSKSLDEQPGSPVFVEWDGHWYGVPNRLVHNMTKAGFTVRTKLPETANFSNAPKPKL